MTVSTYDWAFCLPICISKGPSRYIILKFIRSIGFASWKNTYNSADCFVSSNITGIRKSCFWFEAFLHACRAMNAAPYNLGKNSTECTAQECDGANFASTAAGTSSLSESKENNHDVWGRTIRKVLLQIYVVWGRWIPFSFQELVDMTMFNLET